MINTLTEYEYKRVQSLCDDQELYQKGIEALWTQDELVKRLLSPVISSKDTKVCDCASRAIKLRLDRMMQGYPL